MKREEFLIDDLKIYQDDELYRFTSDSVLLSKFANAKKNDVVADFCSGSGIVGLHFYALNKNVVKKVVLFEMQPELANLSKESVELNGLENIFTVENLRIQNIPKEYVGKFSLILCNPPYFKDERNDFNYDKIKACRNEQTVNLEEIVVAASKSLKYGGRFCVAHITDRLPELFVLLVKNKLEPKRLTLVSSKWGIYLVLVEAVKGGKPGLKIQMIEN